MSPRTLGLSALTLASLPLALGAILWHGAFRRRDLMVNFDPFEIDLQLHERNDEPAA